jgi:hypothetical protein
MNRPPVCAVGVIGAGAMGVAMLFEDDEKYHRMGEFLKRETNTEGTARR